MIQAFRAARFLQASAVGEDFPGGLSSGEGKVGGRKKKGSHLGWEFPGFLGKSKG